MTFILFSWAALASLFAFGFCLLWRVEVAIRLKRPALMSREDVEASLRAARELPDEELHALAETLTLQAKPKPSLTWAGRRCSNRDCIEKAVTRWVDAYGKTWYACSLHWENDRRQYTVRVSETLQ